MKNISLVLLIATILLFSCKPSSQTEETSGKKEKNINKEVQTTSTQKTNTMDINMFPKAKKDEIQHIIELAVLENEQANKIEVFVTKTMEVDCNHHSLTGKLETKELSGWGYDYYLFNTNGDVISTMMACPDSSMTKKDIPSESKLLNYNSKLPIIVYTPKGYKVKYKLWTISSEENIAKPVVSAKE